MYWCSHRQQRKAPLPQKSAGHCAWASYELRDQLHDAQSCYAVTSCDNDPALIQEKGVAGLAFPAIELSPAL